MPYFRVFVRFLFFFVLIAGMISGIQAEEPVVKERMFYVSDYKAVPDGKTLNTKAIQAAIDACHKAGGGTVRFTRGRWMTGTIILKSGVRLDLDQDAVLLGSPHLKDYSNFLIEAYKATNIAVSGLGTIDGNGENFWDKNKLAWNGVLWTAIPGRPERMFFLVDCKKVSFREVTLRNSSCWTLHLRKCENVSVHGITIDNPVYGPNTDGIDIDCCKKVVISDCNISGGDDAIALKSDSQDEFHCEDIAVSNCNLSAGLACGVRVGFEGDAIIRNCSFSNLVITDSYLGIDMAGMLPKNQKFIKRGSRVENITFNNINMRNVGNVLHFWMDNQRPPEKAQVYLRNIRISNLLAECHRGCFLSGYKERNIENIHLSGIHLIQTGEADKKWSPIQKPDWFATTPYAFYCRYVDGLSINDLTVDWSRASGSWLHSLFFKDCSRTDISDFAAILNPKLPVYKSSISMNNTTGRIRNSSHEGALPFLELNDHSEVFMYGNDLPSGSNTIKKDATSKIR